VYELVPAFLDWLSVERRSPIDPRHHVDGRERYREIRRMVIDSGIERDAANCLAEVLAHLEVAASPAEIDRGLDSIFRPTLIPAQPMPGVVDSIRMLREAGVPLLVVSSAAYHPFLEWTLERFGILDCFEGLLTSASCGHYKSTHKIYELAAATLDRAPEDCIHIGDSELFDVRSARNAGMRTVLVDWTQSQNGASEADLKVDTLVDLPARLVERFGRSPHAL
jgi:HAD superfamily hydrolase (TIGR01509 family)